MIKREAVAYHVAGHVVMACLRKVDFESVSILQNFRYACGIDGCNYQSSVPNDLDRAGVQVYTDVRRIEIGLAGPFAHGLYVGEFTAGSEATERHERALDAHLKGSQDLAVLNALAGEVQHLNACVDGEIIDKVIWSPSARTILFDLSDHWDQVEAVATALIARESLARGQVHRIIQAEPQRGLPTRPVNRARVKKVAG